MSDTTKVKVLDVKTSGAVKSVEKLTSSFVPLRKQIRDLQNQLAQLEKGTEEYNRVATQLSNVRQKQIEINETAKYSNKDFGQTMENMTNISLSLVGGINAVSASMVMLGKDSEEIQKIVVPLQVLQASITGLSQLDRALKSLNGLKNAFIGVSESATSTAKSVESVTHTVDTLATATSKVDGKTIDSLTTSATTATTAITKGSATATKGLKGIVQGFKNAAKAVKAFIVSNPILLAIAAAIGAVVAAITIMNKKMQENGKLALEEANILSSVNNSYDEQNVRLNVLLKTAQDNNESLAERKKAVEELNKLIPDYNAKIDETTGAYKANTDAIDKYLQKMRQKMLLEAYEGKIKELLKEQIKLEERANQAMYVGWGNTQKRVNSIWEQVQEIMDEIEYWYGKIRDDVHIDEALDENKVTKSGSSVQKTLKSIDDALKELKKTSNDFWETFYNVRQSKRKFVGPKDDLQELLDDLTRTLKKTELVIPVTIGGETLKTQFTEEFLSFIKGGVLPESFKDGFDFSKILKNVDVFDKLSQKAKEYGNKLQLLEDKYKKLSETQGGKLTESQTKEYEQTKKNIENTLSLINNQIDGYNQLVDSVYKYVEIVRDGEKEQFNQNIVTEKHNEQLKIEKQYLQDIQNNNPYADIDKTISSQELEYKSLSTINDELKRRKEILEQNSNNNGLYAEEIVELNKQIEENERELANKEVEIDRTKWNKRVQEAENYYNTVYQIATEQSNKLVQRNTLLGFGTASFDTAYKQQLIVTQSIQDKIKENERNFYENQLISYETYLARKNELEKQYSEESVKLDQLNADKKIDTMNATYSAMQSVYGAIGDILDNEMSKYEEGSEEYKRLAVAKAISDTIMGSLSAFVSGVQSGLPVPANFILGAALAGTTTALGLSSISNIKSGNLNGSSANLTSGASGIGSSNYETISYLNQSELLGNIKDNRVIVTEHDISSTQNKVRVREQNAIF